MITITELIIASQIRIDFDKGYTAYLDEPEKGCKAARVEFDLCPSPLLIKMANLARKEKGFVPINLDRSSPKCRNEREYRFTCDLNEYDEKRVDSFILFDVLDSDAGDYEELYTIDLSSEEQQVLFHTFCEQLRTIGKTCSDLFREAWKKGSYAIPANTEATSNCGDMA